MSEFRGDRLILNSINELRRKRLSQGVSDKEAKAMVGALSIVFKRVEVTRNHRQVIREWRKLCDEVWPVDRWTWVDQHIESQIPPK